MLGCMKLQKQEDKQGWDWVRERNLGGLMAVGTRGTGYRTGWGMASDWGRWTGHWEAGWCWGYRSCPRRRRSKRRKRQSRSLPCAASVPQDANAPRKLITCKWHDLPEINTQTLRCPLWIFAESQSKSILGGGRISGLSLENIDPKYSSRRVPKAGPTTTNKTMS